jgi:sensor histidine kinase YesM
MILQPLVENSIRHGIAPKKGGGCIEIGAGVKTERCDCLCRTMGWESRRK